MDRTADSFQVSPQQEALWVAEPAGPASRVQAVAALAGPLDVAALEAALRQVVARHESLRTTFLHQTGLQIPVQAVNEHLDPDFRTAPLDGAAAGELQPQVERLAAQELLAPFDLTEGPLVRALLATDGGNTHRLIISVSSLCADPASMTLLVGEVAAHYAGTGEVVEDPLQYADFSAWQRELLESDEDEAKSAAGFWEAIAQARTPSLPFAVESAEPFVPAHVELALDDAQIERIRSTAARYGGDATAFVQAAWHAVIGRFAAEEAVTIASIANERRHADLDGALGAFARPVPIETAVGGEKTFAELLSEISHARADALAWQDYAHVDAGSRLAVGFVECEPFSGQVGEVAFGLTHTAAGFPSLRLWLTCTAGPGALRLALDFDPASYPRDSVGRLAGALQRTLAGAVEDPGVRIGRLKLVGDAERAQLLLEFNATETAFGEACVHELIAARAAATPGAHAVADEHGALTYGELDARANQLAHRLRRDGVGPDVAVGLCMSRSADMVVGLLGILKAGGAYVPLHYEHPAARLGRQLAAAGATTIVTEEALIHRLPEVSGEVICLDRDRAALDGEEAHVPDSGVTPENLAYITFTSGSTGAPKGVLTTHANLANYARDIARRTGADSSPLAFGVVTSISTDLGNTSLYGALSSGGTVVLIEPAAAADPGMFVRAIARNPVDVLKITPSHVGALLAGDEARVLPRTLLVLGGERVPWDLIDRVRRISDVAILNHYGPTETTVGSCTFPIADGPGEHRPGSVPIGRPISNTSCYVLDDELEPVPLGVAGRLFVGGAGVARGYASDETLTAERFLVDPFAPGGGRMYDTGDRARWLPDGALEFLGRADEQVKIRGYRVEPAEVDEALRAHGQVRDCITVAHETAGGELRLVAYCAIDGTLDQEELRLHLAGWLPEFMLPSAIAIIDQLPRTPSGKIDKQGLPDPESLAPAQAAYVAPRTPLEETIAGIWAQVLGVSPVGVDDDFFALGGHSLLATQVVAQVRSDFAVDLPLHSLFTYPTVATLTEEIMSMMGASEEDETARLIAELEGMSDEEAERLLAEEQPPS